MNSHQTEHRAKSSSWLQVRKIASVCLSLPTLLTASVFTWTMSANAGAYDQAVLDAGLRTWRTSLDAKGRACVNCHGAPDGFDLAYFNFTDDDIRRRDLDHVSSADSEKIVALVHELRKKYDITTPFPKSTRVFQPGGSPFPGATMTERDAALATDLLTKLPTLAAGNVNSDAVSEQAITEVLNLNLSTQRVGVLLPTWSEDKFFGLTHGRLTDWISDEAIVAPTAEAMATFLAIQDAYLADPSETNMWKIYGYIKDGHMQTTSAVSTQWTEQRKYWQEKYLLSLLGSHDLRMKLLGRPTVLSKNGIHTVYYTREGYGKVLTQPHFNVADPVSTFGILTSETAGRLDPAYSGHQHQTFGALAWWWLGFMYNPALQTEPERQEYAPNGFMDTISDERKDQGSGYYPMHALLLRTKSDLALYRLIMPNSTTPIAYGAQRAHALPPFLSNPRVAQMRPIPQENNSRFFDDTHRARYTKFACNTARMRLYMIKKQIESERAAGKGYRRMIGQNEAQQYQELRNCIRQLNALEPANITQNNSLMNAVRSAQSDWKRGSTLPYAGSGTGLKAEIYNNLDFTGLLTTRTDSSVNFDNGIPGGYGGTNGLIYSGAGTDVAVRWTGFFQPQFTDTYTFYAMTPGDSLQTPKTTLIPTLKVWINGTLVIDRSAGWEKTQSALSTASAGVSLTAGTKYPIKIEYSQPGTHQMCSIWHQSNKLVLQAIPTTTLYPQ